MREYRVDPSVNDVPEMDDLFEIQRDTDEYEGFYDRSDYDDCIE